MNSTLLASVLSVFSFAVVVPPGSPEPREPQAESVALRFHATPPSPRTDELERHWSATEREIERDVAAYRGRSSEELESLGLAIAAMERRFAQSPLAARSYLRTRIQALREHLDFARDELVALPGSQSEETFMPAHARFFRTLSNLESALAQTAEELSEER